MSSARVFLARHGDTDQKPVGHLVHFPILFDVPRRGYIAVAVAGCRVTRHVCPAGGGRGPGEPCPPITRTSITNPSISKGCGGWWVMEMVCRAVMALQRPEERIGVV